MATILEFPTKPQTSKPGLIIELYTDEEIELTLAAVNVFGREQSRITWSTLSTLEAESVERCLRHASISELFSRGARALACHILSNIDRVTIKQQK
jgi:hypothetical protein